MNYTLKELNTELSAAIRNFADYHSEMDRHLDFYENSAFFPTKSGQLAGSRDVDDNLLRVFADKNIHFTSAFPTIKVPTTGASPEQRQSASIREKMLLSVWRESGGPMLQRDWSEDGTLLSAVIAETGFNFETRKAFVKRHDPRDCFWQYSNGNHSSVTAFWSVVPITADEAEAKYGVRPRSNGGVSLTSINSELLNAIDGKDWFLQVTRLDDNIRVSWIGDTFIEEPHQHMMGGIPIDIVKPFSKKDRRGRGAFYLAPLVKPQANLNRTIFRRDNIVKRYASPVMWGRGMIGKQLEDLKNSLQNGGLIGLKQGGEMGILQLNDLRMLSEHEQAIRDSMLRMSGFSAAAMGELAGANTSGDALGMYFTPTQRHIENQNIAWRALYESVNAKILRVLETFNKTGETFKVAGYAPKGTLMPMADNPQQVELIRGGYDLEVNAKQVIAGNYNSIVVFNPVTPKNELEEKRLVMDMMASKTLSRTTGFEMIGIESPEDELALLTQEQSEPALNPQGMQQMVAAMTAAQSAQQPQTPQPVAQEIAPHVRDTV